LHKILHSWWSIILISSLAICIVAISVVRLTFQNSEKLLIEKTTTLISANLSKDKASISNMLYDVQKISAITSTNKSITQMLAAGARGNLKSSFLDYSIEDLNRITQLEAIITNYRNTLFDYQMHMIILGNDGSLYSVLDGVGNRYQFSSALIDGLRRQPWFTKFLASDQKALWRAPYFYDDSTGALVARSGNSSSHILFCRKIYDYYSQQELGVAVVSLLSDNLRQNWVGNEATSTGLVNSDGNIIYSNGPYFDAAYFHLTSSWNIRSLSANRSEYTVVRSESGESYVLTSTPLPFDNWLLLNLIPRSSVTREIELMRNNTYTICVLVLLAALVICALMLIYIMRPYNRILKKMTLMQIGNVPVGRQTEKIISIPDAERKFNQMTARIEEMTAAALEKQALEEKMRYETLRAQLDPHFLFNTLNTIKWSAMASNAGNIADMIACLGGVLENAIRRGEEEIPLSKELELVRSYIQIKNWTLKHRYELKIEVSEQFYKYPVFKYCLQPIVENAVIHGIEGMHNGAITIRARQERCLLFLDVHNNGTEMAPEQIKSVLEHVRSSADSRKTLTGVGLSSIDGMVKLRYGKKYGISMISAPGRGTTVSICLPYLGKGKGEDTDEGTFKGSDR